MSKFFPTEIPIFPLQGVVFFPKTNLPLNIFEQRYLDMTNDCIKGEKLMGMVQPKIKGNDEVFDVGCLGKITDFERTKDGRILINLNGIIRFRIKKEINNKKLYRKFEVNYNDFIGDMKSQNNDIPKKKFLDLMDKSKKLFKKNGYTVNWIEFSKLNIVNQINTLAMITPISVIEKQKLLETITTEKKIEILNNIIDFNLHDVENEKTTIQ